MLNIILSGGSGTRLWPISRKLFPKQFNKIIGNQSLFQKTAIRNRSFCDHFLIITNQEQYFMAKDQLDEIDLKANFLLEPVGKNTAPAIALACFGLDKDDIVLVTPSDHIINHQENYSKVIKRAKELAKEDFLVTFGIVPHYPESGYGYIEAEDEDVIKFHEKPNPQTAKRYLQKGNFYWNSGIFCFKAGIFLDELKLNSPDVFEASKIAFENSKKEEPFRIKQEFMENIPEISIDYAIMEKTKKAKVIKSDIAWNDLGSFDALYDILPKDKHNNTITQNSIHINSKNNLLLGDEKLIATIDLEDLIIVNTPDALLISKKGSSQKVKEVVKKLKEQKSELHNIHLTAHRPWGTYTILEEAHRYKIKRIVVKPGKRLSLQKHFHRNEHWIVVSGTATVRVGEKEMLIRANESTYIPMGEVHRLENNGKINLILIEAQVGEYLEEDDIVRMEDDFKR